MVHTRPDSVRIQARLSVPVDGSRRPLVRSLGTTDASRGASVASSLQALADGLPSGDWLRIKRCVEDIFLAAGHPVPLISREALPVLRLVESLVSDYLKRKRGKVMPSHYALMKRCLHEFSGTVRGLELVHVKGHHVQAWLDGLVAGGLSSGSVRNQLSCVAAFFRHAVLMGFLSVNPCAGVEVPDGGAAVQKEPMSDEDFAKLVAYLRAAGEWEWLTVCMIARYAGLRLVDSACVSGAAVSFADGACLLDVTAGKTGKAEVIPVFEPLASFLRAHPEKAGKLAPGLAEMSASVLSKRFSALCDGSGICPQILTLPNGRRHRRISFHSLKHSYVTDLSRRGIPQHLRMKLSAHVSESSHQVYDHVGALDLYRQVAGYFEGARR